MVTATVVQGGQDPSSTKMEPGKQEAEVVRLRVSLGGRFVQTEQAVWKYVGGDTFMQTLPVTWRYAELMFSLAEKVDGAVSVKYQLPGEELDPDSLISVSDDSDLQELFDEYARALRLPGTPVKAFRLRVFLFRAAEDPLTPEDIAAGGRNRSSRTSSSADKIAKDSALTKVLNKAATNSYASNYSSGSSSANVMSQAGGPSPLGVESETELAWEAGFRAGQEAMAMVAAEAAEEEWEQLMSRRMVALAKMQSHYMLGNGEELGTEEDWGGEVGGEYTAWATMPQAAAAAATVAATGSLFGPLGHPSFHTGSAALQAASSRSVASSQLASAAGGGGSLAPSMLPAASAGLMDVHVAGAASLLGDLPVDMEASLVDVSDPLLGLSGGGGDVPFGGMATAASGTLAGLAMGGAMLSPPLSPSKPLGGMLPPGSHAPSRIHSPRAQPPLAASAGGSRLGSPRLTRTSPSRRPLTPVGLPGSSVPFPLHAHPALHPQQAPLSPSRPAAPAPVLHSQQHHVPQMWQQMQPVNLQLEEQASVHMADVPSAEFEAMFESKYSVPMAAGASGNQVVQTAGGSGREGPRSKDANAGRSSPKSLLPTHISAFGDGTEADLAQAAAMAAAAATSSPVEARLPTHISEFGEDDGEEPLECDPKAMSVMKAALPEEDLMLESPAPGAVGAMAAAAAAASLQAAVAKLPPRSLQLPTTFELLVGDQAGGGGGRGGAGAELAAAAGALANLPQDMLAEDVVGALPQQPSTLHRSPSVEELLRKVQCVDARHMRVLAKIGEGAFGEVSLAECPTYGRVAVKWIKPTKVERHWASFWHEAELMSRLNHPNVLRFYGLVVKGPLVVGIMTEFAKNGSLASFLRSGAGFIPLRLRAELALHAVHGMAYLHAQRVVHFDVKPDNLLVDGDLYMGGACPVVKVADFGLSKWRHSTFCSNVHDLRGTLPYMAPETIMDHQHVTEKADVWSLGVVFWEMLTLEVPYADMPPAQLIGALGLGKLRLPIPDWCEPEWRLLMESCWVVDPSLRPSCHELAAQLERIRDSAPV